MGREIAPSRPGNYAVQAGTYDLTRGASPTVIRALSKHLGPGEGRSLLDVGGGTGNYAQAMEARGFRVTVVDAQPAMLAHGARKLGPGRCVAGDAQALPIGDGTVDCVDMVNVIHLLDDPLAALREARRVLRGGPLCLTAFTRENQAPLFVFDYFGREDILEGRPSDEEVETMLQQAGFSRVEHQPYIYTDTVDGSLNALHTDALRLAGPAYLRNTSLWHRLDEETRRKGLDSLARDLRSGVLEERVKESFRLAVAHGHGTVFAASP
jgi:SAM-dependent methyltransferase